MTFQVSFPSLQDRETALETLVILAELGQDEPVRAGVATLHPADIAELLDALEEPEVKQKVFRFLDPDLASAVLSFVSPRTQAELTEELSSAALGELVERLDSDDAADLLAALPEAQARAVLEQVPQELSAEMEQLLRYPPDTAGGIMQTEHVAVPAGTPVEQAIEIIRGHIDEVPDIHNVFVVDRERRLVGVLPLRKLILARPHDLVEQLMDRQVISARVDLDQEQVARLFKRYDLVSVPVVDASGTLLGRITVDDVVDVLEEEASEDIYRLAGLGGEEPVLDSPWRSIRRRLPWLGLNLVTTTLSATVISFFEGTIQAVAIAAAFMTIVAAQGGNAGIQTLTVIVRGLALGEVSLSHVKRVLLNELLVALGNGLALGAAAGLVAYLWKGEPLLGAVLTLALLVNLLVAAFIGSMIPFTMRWLGIDPAIASNVFVTACTDICGFLSFLGILTLFLHAF
ncbi:MAG: magnesium transporter [Thermodesulfobacteriota bacterium]|jgi:magnesium transporter